MSELNICRSKMPHLSHEYGQCDRVEAKHNFYRDCAVFASFVLCSIYGQNSHSRVVIIIHAIAETRAIFTLGYCVT